MDFKLKLRYWILKNFDTISAFSDELGVSQTNISRYLNGSRKPGHDFYKKINKMGCDLNWLIGDEKKEKKSIFKKLKENKFLVIIFLSLFNEENYLAKIFISF